MPVVSAGAAEGRPDRDLITVGGGGLRNLVECEDSGGEAQDDLRLRATLPSSSAPSCAEAHLSWVTAPEGSEVGTDGDDGREVATDLVTLLVFRDRSRSFASVRGVGAIARDLRRELW